jgi:hypothetical protein
MPAGRPRNDAKHLRVATDALMRAVSSLADRIGAFGVEVNNAKKPKPGGGNARLASVWASYTPKQRAARIAAMKAGHAKRKRRLAAGEAAKKAAPKKAAPPRSAARKSAWASMTPEQRAERMAKMRAGRKGAAPAAAITREASLLND